jgi:ribonuclease III
MLGSEKQEIDMADFQQRLGFTFHNTDLLKQALTHSSYLNENKELAPVSNERLEFLGDALLGLIIAEKLYSDFPQYTEGEMTQIRAALVNGDTLCKISKAINIGDFLIFGKGEEATGGREKSTNLESALEAVIAAVYLDRGLASTRGLVLRLFAEEFEKAIKRTTVIDYKSKLQEVTQEECRRAPVYLIIDVAGSEHERQFTVDVKLDDIVLGRGTGRSKKAAEAEAARVALENLSLHRT